MCGGGGNCGEEDVDGSVTGLSESWVPCEKVDGESREVDIVVEEAVGFSSGGRRDAGKVHEVGPREEAGDLAVDLCWDAHHCSVATVPRGGQHYAVVVSGHEVVN